MKSEKRKVRGRKALDFLIYKYNDFMENLSENFSQLGYSKNKFGCNLCKKLKHAHELDIQINRIPARAFRIICIDCISEFNLLPNETRVKIIWSALEICFGKNQFIYGLFEPNSEILRYVGRTNDIKRRFQRHLQQGADFLKKLDDENFSDYALDIYFYSSKKWIADLKLEGKNPEMKILEIVEPTPKVYEQEMRWICQPIKENKEILNVENNSEEIKNLILSSDFSFKTVSMDYLKSINFIGKIISYTSHMNKESGWEKAFLVYEVLNNRELIAQ